MNNFREDDMNEAYNNIITRRSCRCFTGKKISREILDLIITAGLSAPSPVNTQPWEIFVIEDREILSKIANLEGFFTKMTEKASVAIIVCGNTDKSIYISSQYYWVQAASAVSENILLAVNSFGLGAVWTSVYPIPSRIEVISDLLNLPSNIIPLNIIPIGRKDYEEIFEKNIDKTCIHFGKWTE